MRALRAIGLVAQRELQAILLQPLAWVVLTVLWFFAGLAFWRVISDASMASFAAKELQSFLFQSFLFWLPLMVAIPVIAMRLLAEERQTGTLEMLLTAPVTETEVTLGKYIAALGFYVLILLPDVLFLVLLDHFADVDWSAAMAGLLGVVLSGAFLLAAAFCASALTRNQIIAAIVGFVVVLLLYVGPFFVGSLAQGTALEPAWEQTNLWLGLDSLSRGIVNTRHLIYPSSGIVFCLFLTSRLLEASKGK